MRIGIIGTGLIGGSLGLALKRSGKHKVYCWNRRPEVSAKAVKLKAADKYFHSIEALTENSDVIILATPLGSYAAICKKISPWLDGKKIITDVGSVKNKPVQVALKNIPAKYKSFFVPAHPIAGKENGGIENADANLFKGKKLIICKTSSCNKGKAVAKVWKDAGAEIELLNAEKHDEIYAYVSHYVQFLSHTIAKFFPNQKSEFTRLMNSPKELWADIFKYNSANLRKVNAAYIKALSNQLKKPITNDAPYILSSTLNDLVPEKYKKYAGSGFKSFTSPLLKANNKLAKTNTSEVKKILKAVINELKKAKI